MKMVVMVTEEQRGQLRVKRSQVTHISILHNSFYL